MHEEFRVRADAVDVVPRIVRHYGEPFADSSAIPSFYLAEMTRRHVTVALNGDGGDESFAGYTRYVANALAGRLERIPAPLRRGSPRSPRASRTAATSAACATSSGGSPARSPSTVPGATPATCRGSTPAQRAALYTPEFAATLGADPAERVIADAWAAASGASAVDRMLEVDVSTYLVDDLIAKIDIATMAHALEARSPFLDPELMQLAALDSCRAEGARPGEEVDPARGAARLGARRRPRPAQAGLLGAASDWLRTTCATGPPTCCSTRGTLERGYFEPDRGAAGCSSATTRGPTAAQSRSGRS